MVHSEHIKNKAIGLRRDQKLSCKEISNILQISKSTLERWILKYPLNKEESAEAAWRVKKKGNKDLDLTGRRFGRLIAIEKVKFPNKRGFYWKCICECGSTTIVKRSSLIDNKTKSCGCLNIERRYERKLPLKEASRNAVISRYKYQAKNRGYKFLLSLEECEQLFKGVCFYCGTEPSNRMNHYINENRSFVNLPKNITKDIRKWAEEADYIYSGIDRVDNNKDYIISNCVSCCKICNRAKLNRTFHEFESWLDRLVTFNG